MLDGAITIDDPSCQKHLHKTKENELARCRGKKQGVMHSQIRPHPK